MHFFLFLGLRRFLTYIQRRWVGWWGQCERATPIVRRRVGVPFRPVSVIMCVDGGGGVGVDDLPLLLVAHRRVQPLGGTRERGCAHGRGATRVTQWVDLWRGAAGWLQVGAEDFRRRLWLLRHVDGLLTPRTRTVESVRCAPAHCTDCVQACWCAATVPR